MPAARRRARGALGYFGSTRSAPGCSGRSSFTTPRAAGRALGWARLAAAPRDERRIAVVLSDYPGASGDSGQIGHAVGLDSFASLESILSLLGAHGYDTGGAPPGTADLTRMLTAAPPAPALTLLEYRCLLAALPDTLRQYILACWGEPDADPAVQDGRFMLRHVCQGRFVLAVQPERGRVDANNDRDAVVAAYSIIRCGSVIYLRNIDWPRKPDIEEIPDRFVQMIVPKKIEEPKPASDEKNRLRLATNDTPMTNSVASTTMRNRGVGIRRRKWLPI